MFNNPKKVDQTGTLVFVEAKIRRAGHTSIKIIELLSSRKERLAIEVPMNYETEHISNMVSDFNKSLRSFTFLNQTIPRY